MANRMILNETAWFGRGAINALTDEAVRRGYRKALIVTDSTLARCGVAAKVTDKLDAAGLAWDIFSDVIPNPTIAVVQQGLQAFQRSGADYLIAIGGGSPQDTCKAIGIIQRNPEFADVRSLEGLSPTRQPSVPIFAVPTTAGTAAEVTINYVITDEEQRRKFVCVDPHDIPQVAFIDADMMDAMPPALKAATGVDALTHAIEGYLTRAAWASAGISSFLTPTSRRWPGIPTSRLSWQTASTAASRAAVRLNASTLTPIARAMSRYFSPVASALKRITCGSRMAFATPCGVL